MLEFRHMLPVPRTAMPGSANSAGDEQPSRVSRPSPVRHARQPARAAAGAPVESAVLRRSRHAHRRRRHLVLSQDPDRPAGAGEAVRLGAQAGRATSISWSRRSRNAASWSTTRRSWRSSSRSERASRGQVLHFRTNVDDWVACGRGPRAALRAGAGDRRAQALSACAARSVGEGDAARCSTIWSNSARSATIDGERMFGVASGGRVLRHGAGRQPEGISPDGRGAAERRDRCRAHDFFAARARGSTLDVPAALTDPTRCRPRAAISISIPSLWERAGVQATRPAAVLVPVVDRAEPQVLLTLRTELPEPCRADRVSRRQDRSADATPAAAALREAEEEIGLDRALVEPIGYLDLYLTFSGYRILPTVARVGPDYRLALNAARGRRRLRGAARLPDGRAEPRAAQPRLEGHDAASTTPCRSASATSGA